MKQKQVILMTCVAVATLAGPSTVLGQSGRGVAGGLGSGVGIGAGGAGRVGLPPVTAPQVNLPPAAGRGTDAAGGGGRQRGPLGGSAAGVAGIEQNSALSARARPLLPAGADLGSASAGFRNETDFMAALHASRRLDIPFDQVKGKMTEGRGRSLDKAIQTLRPDIDKGVVKQSVKEAERMARDDVRAAKRGRKGASVHADGGAAAEIRVSQGLSARVQPLLPEGMSLDQASAGFRNTGQFIAALHAAKNLDIPFRELRARMIAGGESLGEAIRGARPAMAAAEIETGVQAAVEAADRDLKAESASSASVGAQGRID